MDSTTTTSRNMTPEQFDAQIAERGWDGIREEAGLTPSLHSLANTDAERGFLASCVKGQPEPLLAGVERLTEAHFTTLCSKLIWRTLTKITAEELDEFTVMIAMGKEAVDNCGQDEVMNILNSCETSINWELYIDQLESALKLRTLNQMALETAEGVKAFQADPDAIVESCESKLMSLQRGDELTFMDAAEVAALGATSLKERSEGKGGITIGIPSVDNITGGFRGGELVVLSARPSVGKTAFALGMLRSLSVDRAHNTLFFSLEMGGASLGERLLSSAAKVPMQMVIDKNLDTDKQERYDDAIHRVGASSFWVEERSDTSVAQIRARARRMKMAHGLDMVIVDYCQLVKPAEKNNPREQQIAQISRDLKALAKDLDVPVVLLAQLNRESERMARPPRLSDLRESGALEQDADQVLFLHRPDPECRATINVVVGKNRCGRCGDTDLWFTASTQRFSEKED